jgi:hypothetical protein
VLYLKNPDAEAANAPMHRLQRAVTADNSRANSASCDFCYARAEIKAAAEALGIAIHDHLVIGRKGHASFRSLGLLS